MIPSGSDDAPSAFVGYELLHCERFGGPASMLLRVAGTGTRAGDAEAAIATVRDTVPLPLFHLIPLDGAYLDGRSYGSSDSIYKGEVIDAHESVHAAFRARGLPQQFTLEEAVARYLGFSGDSGRIVRELEAANRANDIAGVFKDTDHEDYFTKATSYSSWSHFLAHYADLHLLPFVHAMVERFGNVGIFEEAAAILDGLDDVPSRPEAFARFEERIRRKASEITFNRPLFFIDTFPTQLAVVNQAGSDGSILHIGQAGFYLAEGCAHFFHLLPERVYKEMVAPDTDKDALMGIVSQGL
ncbi:hypothetical protein JXB02_05020 [Candidatus Woesearchaeota archaeon]|nr:hypothetical protein [Candidatus Woesearchaeota archaeon]